MATATDDNAEIRNLDARLFENQLVGTLVLCGNTKIPLTVVSYCERDFTF